MYLRVGFELGRPGWANFLASGDCLLGAVFYEIKKVAHIFWELLYTIKVMHYFWQNNGMGYILSDVFTNSSGHPVLP
jgi:hypothetical protein